MKLPIWQALTDHQQAIAHEHLRDWFNTDPLRFVTFSTQVGDIFLDYSRNRVTQQTMALLVDLAKAGQLQEKIDALFSGEPINHTEKRPALHTALRDKNQTPILVNNINIALGIAETQAKMREFTQQIHDKTWRGVTGKPIKHIVNVGIGGSHQGPRMAVTALKEFAASDLSFHFISSVDHAHLYESFEQIDPETTLFIISSKSFNTIETLTNARTLLAWMQEKLGPDAIKKHFVAVTAAPAKAIDFGIPKDNIFLLWDWVGGRYSIWSAIGLPLMLLIGTDQFSEFLNGAHEMDEHFRHTEFSKNMPVILALLSIWYTIFFHAGAKAIIPYAHRLRYLIPYLQQMEMESNGKYVDVHGKPLTHAVSPVIFGDEGCNGQHTYHQLLHQGPQFIPVDFIVVAHTAKKTGDHQDILIASALSQAQALMRGKTYEEAYNELMAADYLEQEATELAHHQMVPGNRPSNILFIERITPRNLGALIALYEHKIVAQGAILNVNPFDQWGVELGKQLLPAILQYLKQTTTEHTFDSATLGLITRYKKGTS